MTDSQINIPGLTVAITPPHDFTLLTDLEILATRNKLIESNGSMEEAGVTLEHMRNVIYTCRMKANPMQDNGEPAKPKKPKGENSASTKREKLTGDDVASFLG